MAENTELAPAEELEAEAAPAEAVEAAEPVEATEDAPPDPVEAIAAELGWAPKDQFRGSPDDWKPADQFIRDGKDIQRNLSRDLRELKGTVANMSRTSATLLEQQLDRQRQELEARFDEAVEAGDGQAARQLRGKIGDLETQIPQTQAPTSEGNQFIERNSAWYGKDQEATAYAVNRADHYAKQGLSSARQLAAVEQDMKAIFPDLFPAPRTPAKDPPSVARPPSRAAATSSRAKGFHDLPKEAQDVAKDMAERGVIPSTDLYVTNYFNQPERKVG